MHNWMRQITVAMRQSVPMYIYTLQHSLEGTIIHHRKFLEFLGRSFNFGSMGTFRWRFLSCFGSIPLPALYQRNPAPCSIPAQMVTVKSIRTKKEHCTSITINVTFIILEKKHWWIYLPKNCRNVNSGKIWVRLVCERRSIFHNTMYTYHCLFCSLHWMHRGGKNNTMWTKFCNPR